MGRFELLERDGLARIGRLETPHGPLDTPALLPVVHPDPARQTCSPAEMGRRFGVRGVITSSYIAWRTPPLRAVAERDGIHRLVGFDGVVMTDSGAFQQHAYGSVEVGPDEIIAFQEKIGSDIATVLDRFTEPEATAAEAKAAIDTTAERARAARRTRSGLLAVPVQGGAFPDLRAQAAALSSETGDVLAVGGVVPLLEQYRFVELAHVLAATRPFLAPEVPVHLFGTGHPMTFAFAALFGVDLFDSSAYHKFARRGKLLFPEGTVDLGELREPICRCGLCAEHPLREVAGWNAPERETHVALHNLLISVEEIGRVRQAIRDESLWELVERRSHSHPSLRAGLEAATGRSDMFGPTEPESRRAFREIGPESRNRPAVVRFAQRVSLVLAERSAPRSVPRVGLRPEYLGRIPTEDRSGRPIWWVCETPLGPVPLELTEVYPVGPYLGVDEFVHRGERHSLSRVAEEIPLQSEFDADLSRDWTETWTARQVETLLSWQYGRTVSGRLSGRLHGHRSRRTGRLRHLVSSSAPEFVVGNDGLPRPTLRGATELQKVLPAGRHRVVVSDDAAGFVREGRSLFSKFVARADPALSPGASALLVTEDDALLGVGRLLLAPHEMARFRVGIAARVVSHAGRPEPVESEDEAERLEPFPPERPS